MGLLWALVAAAALGAGAPDLGRAIELPAKAQALRDQGVPAAEVAKAIRTSRDHGLTAAESADVLDAAEGERVENLGAFVQEKLDEGLRGRELADAIHAERGKGGKGRGQGGEHGPDAAPGNSGAPADGEKGGKGKSPDAEKDAKGKSKGGR